MLIDGQRVWSFNPERDGRRDHARRVSVKWPKALAAHLDGVAHVELVDHVSRDVLHTQTVRFVTERKDRLARVRDAVDLALGE